MTCTGLELIKKTLKFLRKEIRKHQKIFYDEKQDDIEYLKDNIDELKRLKTLTLTAINIMTTRLNTLALMKLLDICLKVMMMMMNI